MGWRPRLHVEEGEPERHATWLELFFDLVFVVAVAELAHLLAEDVSLGGLAVFAALFVPVWWQWIDFSYYADQYDTGDTPAQVITLLVMFGVIVLALTLSEVTHGHPERFAMAYAALRVVIIALYVWASRSVPEARELARRYSISFSIALALWLISIVVPAPASFVLWGLALLIEISNGPLTYMTIRNVPAQVSHMDERFGLFVILVLGEAVIAVATGVADTEWLWPAVLTGVGGFVVAAGTWWLYFRRADTSVINQALHGNRRALLRSFVYGYSHFFVFAGITAAGVGIEMAIHAAPGELLAAGERAALFGGAATFVLGASVVQWTAPRSLSRPVLLARVLVAAICAALIGIGAGLSPLASMTILAALMLGLIGWEAVGAERHAARLAKPEPDEPAPDDAALSA